MSLIAAAADGVGWRPVAVLTGVPGGAVLVDAEPAVWRPVAADAVPEWVTPETEASVPAYTIVLARRREFLPATGEPELWKPLAGYGYGTHRLSRDLGLGEVLTVDRTKQASPDLVQSATGKNLFGGVLDWTEQVQVLAVVSLLDAESEPDTGDFFTMEGRRYMVFRVTMHNEAGEERSMTLGGVRWNGLTASLARDMDMVTPTFSAPP